MPSGRIPVEHRPLQNPEVRSPGKSLPRRLSTQRKFNDSARLFAFVVQLTLHRFTVSTLASMIDLFSHPFGFDCLANISKFCCNTIKVEHNQFGELRNPIVPMTVKAILIYSRRRLKFKLSSILVTEWFKKVKE